MGMDMDLGRCGNTYHEYGVGMDISISSLRAISIISISKFRQLSLFINIVPNFQ